MANAKSANLLLGTLFGHPNHSRRLQITMERRQKILLALLATIGVVYFGDMVYRRGYTEPLQQAETQLGSFEETLHATQLDVRKRQRRLSDLEHMRPRSLPRNPELAVSEYRSWLLQCLASSGLQQASLDSGNPSGFKNFYSRIDFNVRTHGTLSQLTSFLETFYATPYLHKIRSVSLTPTADGSVDVSMTLETLSIPSLAADSELAQLPPRPEVLAQRESNRIVSQRNLFRQGESPLSSVELSAITASGKHRRQAWLSQRGGSGETRILMRGDQFSLDGTLIEIKQVDLDSVVIAIDGAERTLAIGQTLGN